ncbi:MAG: TetR/AcrR family transcriptional regulator [Myxococcota bacterium]|nr:TetR/AcrR family transcriptional regulator [Myxococcota bacterium]
MAKQRLRRSPEEARNEILEAGEAALAEVEFNQLTVEHLMKRTGMTRSSFYHYFKSLEDVTMALFAQVILMNTAVATDHVTKLEPESPTRVGETVARVWNASAYGHY